MAEAGDRRGRRRVHCVLQWRVGLHSCGHLLPRPGALRVPRATDATAWNAGNAASPRLCVNLYYAALGERSRWCRPGNVIQIVIYVLMEPVCVVTGKLQFQNAASLLVLHSPA